MATPSIFGSQTRVGVLWLSCFLVLVCHCWSSFWVVILLRDSMGVLWVISVNCCEGGAPIWCVGELGLCSSGCFCSSWVSWSRSASYSLSDISGFCSV